MGKFNHAFGIAFEVISEKEDGSDVTGEMLRQALERRIAALDSLEDIDWIHAVDCFDTFEVDPHPMDAVGILRKKYVGDNLERRKTLQQERHLATHEQQLYDEGRLKDDD